MSMSRYAQMLIDFNRQSRPKAFAEITDPETFFTEEAAQIETDVDALHREILGDRRPGESTTEHQIRSSQAWATAEELVLSDHWLLQPESMPEPDLREDDDPAVAEYYRALDRIERVSTDRNW
jgi:hypothetical protein